MSGRQKSINASQARATRTIRSDRAVIERQKDLLKKWERENPIQAQRKRDFVGGLAAALRCKGVTLEEMGAEWVDLEFKRWLIDGE